MSSSDTIESPASPEVEESLHSPIKTPFESDWRDVEALTRGSTRLQGLPGRCRGVVLANWAAWCRRNFGPHAPAAARERLGSCAAELEDAPDPKQWVAVQLHLRLTDAIVETACAGKRAALYDAMLEGVRHDLGRWQRALLRQLGPRRLFGQSMRGYAHLYDHGRVRADVDGAAATVLFVDNPWCADSTWRFLQAAYQRMFVELCGRTVIDHHYRERPEAFELRVGWR